MKHDQLAAKLFSEGCSCSQAVLAAFGDVTGLDQTTALHLASSFGGGMGRLRETCGAVTGAFMVLGLLYGFDNSSEPGKKGEHYARIQDFAAAFREQHETMLCRELLAGLNKDTSPIPEPRTEQYYKTRPCVRFVITAAQLLDEYLQSHPAER